MFGIGAILISSFSGCITPWKAVETQRIKKYCEANYESTKKELEKKYDFEFQQVNLAVKKTHKIRDAWGIYYYHDDSIFLKRALNFPLERKSFDIRNIWVKNTVKGVLIHELIHDYTAQIFNALSLLKKVDSSHTYNSIDSIFYQTIFRRTAISDGLAETIGIKNNEIRISSKRLDNDSRMNCAEQGVD